MEAQNLSIYHNSPTTITDSTTTRSLQFVDLLLRDRGALLDTIREGKNLQEIARVMIITIAICLT